MANAQVDLTNPMLWSRFVVCLPSLAVLSDKLSPLALEERDIWIIQGFLFDIPDAFSLLA